LQPCRCAAQSCGAGCCRVARGKPPVVAKHRRRNRPRSALGAGLPGWTCLAAVVCAGGVALTLAVPGGANSAAPSTRSLSTASAVVDDPTTETTPASSSPGTTDPGSPSPSASSPSGSSVSSSTSEPPTMSTTPISEGATTSGASSPEAETIGSQDPSSPDATPLPVVTPGPSGSSTPAWTGRPWSPRRLSATARRATAGASVLADKVGRRSRRAQAAGPAPESAQPPTVGGAGSAPPTASPQAATSTSSDSPSPAGPPVASQPSTSAKAAPSEDPDIRIHFAPRRGAVLLFCSILALGIFLAAGATAMQGSGAHRRT
jgi:hypothetical protein